jgi:AGZA family xanthine/uracil permease-like MFS transporter
VSLPPDISPVFLQLDVRGALSWSFFAVILTIFVMDFVDTLGTLIALGMKAGMLDGKGNLPEIEKPMLCDALGTTLAALLGTTTTGAYIESATGIEAGGRTGMTAGFVAFPAFKLVAGQPRAVRPGMWVLSALSLAFFLFYPY